MKRTIILLVFAASTFTAFATDRIVQENGPVGTYATITDAITAANEGDRIIVHPKIGDNPYVEDITINKSLDMVSAQDGIRYKIQGNITVIGLNNRTISIIAAHLVSGNISGGGSGWRTNVNIMGCILDGGAISLNNQYYATIVSNSLQNGSINLSHGKVIGNELASETERIYIANATSITNDTMDIIANKTSQIACNADIFLNIRNNFIRRVNSTTINFNSIFYSTTSSEVKMNIYNNTIINPASSTSGSYNYYIKSFAKATISNNIFYRKITPLSIAGNQSYFSLSNSYSSSYNYYYNSTIKLNNPDTDIFVSTAPVDQISGNLILPTIAQNGADPSFEFYDLDLTLGDAGCYGGSYTLDNYFPIIGSSRVYNIDMPFGITTEAGPLNIQADGFDR